MVKKIKAQAAIWIILAIFLVAAIVLFLLVRDRGTDIFTPNPNSDFSIENYLDVCVEREVNRATDLMFPQGGFVVPNSFTLYNKTNIEFICITSSYFEPCINQHPVLIDEMENEILNYISPRIDTCFEEMKEFVERMGGTFEIDAGSFQLEVELDYDNVEIKINKNAVLEYKEEKKSYERFVINVDNSAYNLGVVAIEIANQEALRCYFETAGYTLSQPRMSVNRIMMSDQTKIYTIYDKRSQETMRIAVRSCALPEGMPG